MHALKPLFSWTTIAQYGYFSTLRISAARPRALLPGEGYQYILYHVFVPFTGIGYELMNRAEILLTFLGGCQRFMAGIPGQCDRLARSARFFVIKA